MGNRVFVGNLELRFPLLRPFGVSQGMYGPIPIELALFGDSGVVWSRREPTGPAAMERIISTGLAVRLGLGFAAAEFDVVRPFQRENGWTLGFNLIPGW